MYQFGGLPEVGDSSSLITSSLERLVNHHAQIEAALDDALEQQDCLRKQYYRTMNLGQVSGYNGEMADGELHEGQVILESGVVRDRNNLRVSDLPRKTAKVLMSLARGSVPACMPNSARRAVLNSCTIEISDIDELEYKVAACRTLMASIEEDILEHAPTTQQEAIIKLNFLSGLMMDCREFDQHDLGYFLDEIAAALQRPTGTPEPHP